MSTPNSAKLNEYNHAEEPTRVLLVRLGWTCTPRKTPQSLKASAAAALLSGRARMGDGQRDG